MPRSDTSAALPPNAALERCRPGRLPQAAAPSPASARRACWASLSFAVNCPLCRQRDPRFSVAVHVGGTWFGNAVRSEATSRNANFVRQRRNEPIQRSAAILAKVSLLIVALRFVMESVDACFAMLFGDCCAIEIGRYSECATCPSLAIVAMADSEQRRLTLDGDRSLPTGTGGCHTDSSRAITRDCYAQR